MTERYVSLHAKYLADGSELYSKGDYVQAGEKYWGAVATMVKVVASARGLRHGSHRDLGRVVKELFRQTEDPTYMTLFRSAERLHENFYEGALDGETVGEYRTHATQLIEKLSDLV